MPAYAGMTVLTYRIKRYDMQQTSQLILTTCPDEATAKKIARTLVEKKLAACVKIQAKINAIYYWDNQIIEDNELQLMIITQASQYHFVEQTIKKLHPYDVPEIIGIDINNGSTDYLSWIEDYVES